MQGIEVDIGGQFIRGGEDFLQQLAFLGDHAGDFPFGLALAGEVGFGVFEGGGGGFDFFRMHEPDSAGESFDATAVDGPPVGEENMGHIGGMNAGAFVQACIKEFAGEGGVNEEVDRGGVVISGGGFDQGGGGMGGADGGALVPERI